MGRAYAVSPTETYALSGSISAINSSGITLFDLSASGGTITGSNGATGSISYSSGAFSGSITIDNNTTLSASSDTITSGGNSINYDSSTNTFSGSIPISLSQTVTQSPTCSDGSAPVNGSCSNGAYLTCPSGYTLSSGECSETVTGSFTLTGSGSNINISGGSSTGSISMTQTETCPTGYTLSSGSCVASAQAGTSSTFMCTDTGSEYQDCVSGSILPSGSAELCPYSQTACNENTSTPSCPSGYTWNGSTCTEQVTTTTSPSCPSGYTWNGSTCTEQVTTTTSPSCPSGYTWLSGINICVCFNSGPIGEVNCSGFSTQVPLCPSGYIWNGSICTGTTTQTKSPSCPSGYTYSNGTCTGTTTQTASTTCPSGSTLSGGQCISYTCPLGSPQGQAPGQSDTCVEPSGSSTYYCSPYLCYNDTTNTPVSSTETMPPPQTNNGTVTSSGCQGNIYIFPGQALQCIRDYALGENCCSRAKFLLGGRNCSSNSQILAEAIIYDNQYSPPVPVYSGSGDMNTAPITSCSQSAIDNNACGQLGESIYLGNYCSLKMPLVGTCLAQEYVFCKFQGLLATLIQAQGRAQLAGGPEAVSWGSPQSPNCTGLTPAQFQALNFSNMNLSEYIAVVKSQATNTLNASTIQTQIQNTTNSISNEVQQIESGGALTGSTP